MKKSYRVLTYSIMTALLVLIIISIIAGILLHDISYEIANADPELSHMRIPVYVICVILITIFIISLILSEILLKNILAGTVFTIKSVRLLEIISWLFISGTFPLIILFVMTEMNIKSSITQIYVILFGIIYLTAGLIFRLLANLIKDATGLKLEVDLTV